MRRERGSRTRGEIASVLPGWNCWDRSRTRVRSMAAKHSSWDGVWSRSSVRYQNNPSKVRRWRGSTPSIFGGEMLVRACAKRHCSCQKESRRKHKCRKPPRPCHRRSNRHFSARMRHPHEQTGCRGLLFPTRLFLLLVPFLKSFARSRNYILPHAILLEQTVHLSGGRAKWRDHFLSRLLPNGIVLT